MIENFDIRIAPLPEIMQRLSDTTDQRKRNILIYEIVHRLYVPFKSKQTFEEMLIQYGYKKLENNKVKKLTK